MNLHVLRGFHPDAVQIVRGGRRLIYRLLSGTLAGRFLRLAERCIVAGCAEAIEHEVGSDAPIRVGTSEERGGRMTRQAEGKNGGGPPGCRNYVYCALIYIFHVLC